MITAIINPPMVRETVGWIERQALTLGVPVTVYPNGVRMNGDWLHVPVAVSPEAGDAYDQAVILQQIEEVWNCAPPVAGINLLLVPAKHSEATVQERYEKVNELMGRQRQLLDRMDLADMTSINVQRYQAIRQEWEETVNELARLFPNGNAV